MAFKLPTVASRLIDPATGVISRDWYLALLGLVNNVTSAAVTSVNIAGNNGITVAGSPIVSSGTITLGIGNLTCASAIVAGTVTAANVVATASVQSVNIAATGTVTAARAIVSGTLTAANVIATASVQAVNLSASGTVTAANAIITGTITTANVVATAAVSAVNMSASGTITSSAVVVTSTITDVNLISTGTLTANNVVIVGSVTFSNSISNSLGTNVSLTSTADYYDGPSVSVGAVGTWMVIGSATVNDTLGIAGIRGKLWDGTTIIDSGRVTIPGANFNLMIPLAGVITSPVGPLKISCRDETSAGGLIQSNASGNSKDSTITAYRIA